MNAQTLVNKAWNYAHVLRDDGVSYEDGDTEQETQVSEPTLAATNGV